MWNEKRYVSLDYYLKETFGRKIYKISLNAGMTCPNRDGTLDDRGCIFCSKGGSGDFASSPMLSIEQQIEEGKKLVERKLPQKKEDTRKDITQIESNRGKDDNFLKETSNYIAYFQAFTNTYAPISYLRSIFIKAILHPDIAALSIATRPDCLSEEVISLLTELNQIKPVWVELGLQTCHEESAKLIRRGYSLPVFEEAVDKLSSVGITTIVHVIIGLPYETPEDILQTVSYVAKKPIQGIKLQLLHVLKDTDLAHMDFKLFTMEEYIDIVIQCIEILPPSIVIHRLTGDGNKEELIAPQWSGNKKLVLNSIHKELKKRNTWQGKKL